MFSSVLATESVSKLNNVIVQHHDSRAAASLTRSNFAFRVGLCSFFFFFFEIILLFIVPV